MGWSVAILSILFAQFVSLALLTTTKVAFDAMFGLSSPMQNPSLRTSADRILGITLSISGFLALPAIVGLVIFTSFEASLDSSIRRRIQELDDIVGQSRGNH